MKHLSLVAALLLAGCMNVQLDESDVFKPQAMERKAQTVAEMRLEREEQLTNPSRIPGPLEGRLPATVTHDFLDLGGQRIAVTRIKAKSGAADEPLIVNCAGNASDRFHSGVYNGSKILRWGEVLMFDYPGYGDSSGAATAKDMDGVRDALPLYLDDIAKGRPLVLWGHSLGGFVCSELAERSRETDAVILETTALKASEVAKAWKPWYLPFVRMQFSPGLDAYDVADSLSAFDGPILVIGAGQDRTLPVHLSRSVNAALKAKGRDVRYVEYKRAQHNNAAYTNDFLRDGAEFFAKVTDRNRGN